MATTVSRLTPADLGAMHGALDLFAAVFEDPDSYGQHPSDAYLTRLLTNPGFIVLAACEGERITGALCAYVLQKFEQERSEIYIYDLAVAEDRRRRGIASALIAELQAVATEIGAWVIFVQADYVDPPAIALYEKLGTREEVLHFDIPASPR